MTGNVSLALVNNERLYYLDVLASVLVSACGLAMLVFCASVR